MTAGLIFGLLVIGLAAPSVAADDSLVTEYLSSHQAGVRLGGWSNQGATPPDSFPIPQGGYYETDFGAGSFYLEAHYGHRFSPLFMGEISFGLVSRGDVILVEAGGGSSIGAVQVYPMLAKLKFFPAGNLTSSIFPYLIAGGGVYYGRHDIQIATGYDAYIRQNFGEDSRTAFTYVLGGGFDWPLASVVAIDFQVEYMPIKFSGDLVGIDDYRALTITVGVMYLMSKNKNDQHNQNQPSRRGR